MLPAVGESGAVSLTVTDEPPPDAVAGANLVPLYANTWALVAPAGSISTPLTKRDFRKLAIVFLYGITQ
jgi:hypothetical protein